MPDRLTYTPDQRGQLADRWFVVGWSPAGQAWLRS
jgi:hypothetical protein